LLITYFENRFDIKTPVNTTPVGIYPSVSIIVPCWNEESTINRTVNSLLALDYPKDKLKIMIVDDGSTDSTWAVIQKFQNHSQIEVYKKENGGKHTALNFGLTKLTTDLVGCLDADSFVHKDALKQIIPYFQNSEIMAVAPSIKLWEPRGVLQLLQKVEYAFGIFTRKMFHYMQAVYITPGPFSIFRKEVFEKLGGYQHAHNTEDIEIALRMQKNRYKIAHSHKAYVYTVPPNTIKKLLKQRIRWSHGFIKNAVDYKYMFFNKKYGNLGLFILPMAALSVITILFVSGVSIYGILQRLAAEYVRIQTVGWNFHYPTLNFDWFYINTQLMSVIGLIAGLGTVTMLLISKKMSEGKLDIGMDLIYFLFLYMFIAPLWIGKAAYNAIFSVKTTWR
jgi:cellulose synthase/poly-beta-1,6-N-acetylglucosamine synthase-like glycosyltransferase